MTNAKNESLAESATPQRLAVLPLANLSSDSKDEYFADGMTDELITVLSRLPNLKVIARTSMMRYKGSRKTIAQIGRELGVASMIDGTVRKSQNHVRISVELVDAQTQEHIWAKRYDRTLGDVFDIQNEIAKQVAKELKIRMVGGVSRLSPKANDVDAYTLYLRARYHWSKRSEDGVMTAIRYLEKTVKKDPKFSPALSGLADCYSVSGLFGYTSPVKAYVRAREAAYLALKSGGASAEAHASLGEVLMHLEYDWAGAARELERALQINPNYSIAHAWRSTCYAVLGQLEDAMIEAERTVELDPFAVVAMNEVAKNLYYARRYGDAIKKFTRSLEVEPDSAYLHKGLAEAYAQESMFDDATREIERALTIAGRSAFYLDSAACVYAISNKGQKAREILAEAEKASANHFVPFYGRAGAYAALGEKGKALEMLQLAYDERSWVAWVKVDPIFDSLRNEEGFHSLLRKMNLEADQTPRLSQGNPLSPYQTEEIFEFESDRSGIIFRQLASDFLKDYMSLNYMEEKSGWRSIAEIAKETGIPVSSLYWKAPGSAPPFRELWKRGLVEMRVSPGERGRGGEITKIRVSYGKSPIRNYLDRLVRTVKRPRLK